MSLEKDEISKFFCRLKNAMFDDETSLCLFCKKLLICNFFFLVSNIAFLNLKAIFQRHFFANAMNV